MEREKPAGICPLGTSKSPNFVHVCLWSLVAFCLALLHFLFVCGDRQPPATYAAHVYSERQSHHIALCSPHSCRGVRAQPNLLLNIQRYIVAAGEYTGLSVTSIPHKQQRSDNTVQQCTRYCRYVYSTWDTLPRRRVGRALPRRESAW